MAVIAGFVLAVIRAYRAWAKRQLDRSLQARVIPSQAERWLKSHYFV